MESIIHYCGCCGTEYTCPCEECYPEGNTDFSFERDDCIKCETCGHSDHIDEWDKLLFEQIEEQSFQINQNNMTNIIFKGQRVDTKSWVCGHYFKTPLTQENSGTSPDAGWFFLSDGKERHCISDEHGCAYEVIPETIEHIKIDV